MGKKQKMQPILDGDWWLIGPSPDLKAILPDAKEWERKWHEGGCKDEHNAPVDHHAMQDYKGNWHLWGCVRATSVGRILYHWTANDFKQSPWVATGEIIRVNRSAGESCGRSPGVGALGNDLEECIQSPYFVWHEGLCYMFYGGGAACRVDGNGRKLPQERQSFARQAQMCLMTSENGRTWTRYKNSQGHSNLFCGPGPTRDPHVLWFEDRWLMYYAGTRNDDPMQPVFWCRESKDLVNWSEPRVVHCDLSISAEPWGTECPCVVYKEGYYYLFRTENYHEAKTHVFRSDDPLDFGTDDASSKWIGEFPVGAPEFYIMPDGHEYVSSNHDPRLGTQMCRMRWIKKD